MNAKIESIFISCMAKLSSSCLLDIVSPLHMPQGVSVHSCFANVII